MAHHIIKDANILFYGEDIIVLYKHFSDERCVITFTSRVSSNDIPPAPFGMNMLDDQSCSYICVISQSNHWWQVDNFTPAMQAIKKHLENSRYGKTIVYGGSMGGVGAVHASAILQPDKGVIFSAQYDISPDIIDWDNRWHDDARKLRISLEKGTLNGCKTTEFLYIYDPFNLDRKHFLIFNGFLNMRPLPLPLAGHEVFTTMKEAGVAGKVARHLLLSHDPLQDRAARVRDMYRKSRRQSAIYWRNLTNLAARRGKASLLDYALDQLESLGWSDVVSLHTLGLIYLTKKADPAKAESFYDRCIAIDPDHPAAWRGKAKCRQAKGDMTVAVEFAIAALARNPGSPDLGRVLIEAAHYAENKYVLACAAHLYLANNPKAREEKFIRQHVPDDVWMRPADAQVQKFVAVMRSIKDRRPRRYSQIYQCLRAASPRSILEVGVFDGENALQMIRSAVSSTEDNDRFAYHGFDLFEDMDATIFEKEFSKYPLSQEEIFNKLAPLGVSVSLFRGDTKVTLPIYGKEAFGNNTHIAFAFIDGGHSEETIQSDWISISSMMNGQSQVIFDDYYLQTPNNLKGVGCNRLIDHLKADPKYAVEILPISDRFQKEAGILEIALVRVRLAHRHA
jgi:tetratricopeptide (TPR) repeat protein